MIGDGILVLSLVVMLGYALVVLSAVFLKQGQQRQESNEPRTVSVVIPFRNESASLGDLIHSLKLQECGTYQVNFLLVNDHSEDDSIGIIRTAVIEDQRFRILDLPHGVTGKKSAIAHALNHDEIGELVISADADSVYPERWLVSLADSIDDTNSDVVCAPLSYGRTRGLIASLQRVENLGITAVNAAFQRIGWTVSCSGANMAYLRSVHPGTFDGRSPSGDDMELLIQARRSGGKITWNFSAGTVAQTRATVSIPDFISQRLRWGSKNSLYADYQVIIPGLLIVLTNLCVLVACVLMWFNPVFVVIPLVKVILDAAVLLRFSFIDGIRQDIVYFPLIQLIYPIYIIFIACLSPFAQVSWKGRSIKGDG